MDIKKQYFEAIKKTVNHACDVNIETIHQVAEMFGECMDNGGIVQLFGVKHGEEFVNELNYRAGGIALFHAINLKDLVIDKIVSLNDIDSGKVYEDSSLLDTLYSHYEMDDRDMFCIVSFYGDEPLALEIARRAKAKGQKVVALVNKKSYRGTLLDYADLVLDMACEEPDVALNIDGNPVGQLSSTVSNIIAQMLTAEIYNVFVSKGKAAPVLLSANIKGADVHNNSLTNPYGRRIR